jgi:serine/threonine-protein kinase
MAVAVCPAPETLAAFARGDLTATELATVAEHVGVCEACCRALKFVPEDSLAGLARAAAAAPETLNSGPPAATGASSEVAENQVPAGFVDHPRYRVLSRLGAGGMGTVYKAEDLLMGRVIALKVVSPHLTAKASAVARFRKEIQAAAQLKDHRIVTAHDAGEAGGSHFLVMEFVEGVSLDRLVAKKGPLPVPMACTFTRQAALGLQHAADKQMVHRDIKPQNLMVTRKGQVKILDFGLARFASAEQESPPAGRLPFGAAKEAADAGLTNPNMLMGTPDYLSPEQARNSHDVDPRSDIYSLGCTLYFLLTGQPPFSGAVSLIDKLLAHTREEPLPVREARFEVPQELADVLAKMMAKNPDDRYQKASEVAAALLPFTRSDPAAKEPVFEIVEAAVVSTPPLVVTPVTPASGRELGPALADPLDFDTNPERASTTLADAPRPKRTKKKKKPLPWWKRRKWVLAAGLAALLACVGIGIAANSGNKPTDDKTNEPNPDPGATAKLPAPQPKGGPGGKGGKGTPGTPNTTITPESDELVVLFVIPSDGVWIPDYLPVRRRLEEPRAGKKPVRGETAATELGKDGRAQGANPNNSVAINHKLTDVNPKKFAAVVFTGKEVGEYLDGAGARPAKDVIQGMHKDGKPVAAICVGQDVLLAHNVLKNRKAAESEWLVKYTKRRGMLHTSSITWASDPVVTDRTGDRVVITASGDAYATQFADAILKEIDK